MFSSLLIDVTRSVNRVLGGKRPTGVDRVCLAYLEHYAGQCRGLLWVLGRPYVLGVSNTQWICCALHENRNRIWLVLNLLPRLIWDELRKPKRGEVLLHLGHSGLENPKFGTYVDRHKLRLICMVHDLIPITHPQFCREGTTEKHELRMRHLLKWSSGVLANSQATLSSLTIFAQSQNLPVPKLLVVHLPAAKLPKPSGMRPIEDGYFVVLGTIEGRKNHALLLDVWRKLIEEHGPKTPTLVIIGQRGWACDDVLHRLDTDTSLKPFVLELNDCDDQSLSNWLHHAQALLFPSHIEGYGIPLVEALAAGTPVIASDLEVFHEIAGDIPEYLATDDFAGWLAAIEDCFPEDSPKRTLQLLRLKDFEAPTWETHFAKAETLIH